MDRQIDQQLAKGQDVLDRDGEKIGTVARVYRQRADSGLHSETFRGEMRYGVGFLEVAGAITGVGRTLYVPLSEIMDLDERGIYLNVRKDAIENREWDLRPVALDEPQWEAR